jgi:hypothetical protein
MSILIRIFAVTLLVAFGGIEAFALGTNDDSVLLQTLRVGHPRLLILDEQWTALKKMIETDPDATSLYGQLHAHAEDLLKQPTLTYQIGGPEHTLLEVSREVEGRVWLLAGIYRLSDDSRFAERARDEMLAAARFPDWYTNHFLDTAEMTAALSIGYDWLFHYLSPQDRTLIRQAIVTKGLDPGIVELSTHGKLSQMHNNWVQVCNGGLTMGALAVADEETERAAKIIRLSQKPMENIMKLFSPDGGFEEGPNYWNYATAYNVFYLAALDSALQTDFGLSKASGFAATGNYRMQTIGPSGKYVNFGDASELASFAPQMFWLGKKFNHPEYASHEHMVRNLFFADRIDKESSRFSIMELLWGWPDTLPLSEKHWPRSTHFIRIAAAYFRGEWGDTNAMYIGFKGGSNYASHGHLDLGTFILDAFGVRWGIDLGGDNYGLPGYFGAQRWNYYRLRTEGHNTLTVDGQNEDYKATAQITAFHESSNQVYAIVNLNKAYPSLLSSWQRGIMLINQNQVLIQDEVAPKKSVDLVWNFHTHAAIEIAPSGTEALLSQGPSKLSARILMPPSAKFSVSPVDLPAPQKPTPGVYNLMICLPDMATNSTIVVLIEPLANKPSASLLRPLARWNK